MNTKLILKRIGFYILSFTWGIIMSFIGLFPIAVLACMNKVHVFHGRLYGVVGKHWGGVNFGCFFICGEDSANNDQLKGHECGHGLQNCLWGPLFPFVIAIPSAVRYWYRRFSKKPQPPYDSIWFEGQATKWGKEYILTDKI